MLSSLKTIHFKIKDTGWKVKGERRKVRYSRKFAASAFGGIDVKDTRQAGAYVIATI